MTIDKIRALRQALLDNASGHPLAQVHRNHLFQALAELEQYRLAEEAKDAVKDEMQHPVVETTHDDLG